MPGAVPRGAGSFTPLKEWWGNHKDHKVFRHEADGSCNEQAEQACAISSAAPEPDDEAPGPAASGENGLSGSSAPGALKFPIGADSDGVVAPCAPCDA